jgi:hypothetical protein
MNVRPINREKQRELRTLLKAAWDSVLDEDHSSFHEQLKKLDEAERRL